MPPEGWSITNPQADDSVCGYSLHHPEHGHIFCERSVVVDGDSCFWHQEEIKKSDKIESELETESGPLFGSFLRNTTIHDISFGSTNFYGSDFSKSEMIDVEALFAEFQSCSFKRTTIDHSSFSNCNFKKGNLNAVEIVDSILYNSNLANTDLKDAHIQNSDLSECNISGTTCRDSNLSECELQNSVLKRATLENSDISNCDLGDVDLDESLLWNMHISGNMTNISFSETELTGSSLQTDGGEFADFTGATLKRVDASDCNFNRARFDSDSTLLHTELSRCELSHAQLSEVEATLVDFTRANLFNADLSGSNLRDSILERTNLQDSDLSKSTLTRCDLSKSNLFNTDLREASLYGASFNDAQINLETSFSTGFLSEDSIENTSQAKWIHRRLEKLFRENEIHNRAETHYRERKEIALEEEAKNGRLTNSKWWSGIFIKYSSSFAQSPKRVLVASGVVILGFSVLYPFSGGFSWDTASNPIFIRTLLPTIDLSLPSPLVVLLKSFYFSIVTFTTLGYGTPATGTTQFLAATEALLGSLLMALFLFVLGRRTTQ